MSGSCKKESAFGISFANLICSPSAKRGLEERAIRNKILAASISVLAVRASENKPLSTGMFKAPVVSPIICANFGKKPTPSWDDFNKSKTGFAEVLFPAKSLSPFLATVFPSLSTISLVRGVVPWLIVCVKSDLPSSSYGLVLFALEHAGTLVGLT